MVVSSEVMVHPLITFVSTLDWPDDFDDDDGGATTSTSVVQCAGRGYLAYESRLLDKRDFLFHSTCTKRVNGRVGGDPSSSLVDNDSGDDEGNNSSNKKTTSTKKEYDLLTLSDRKFWHHVNYSHIR